MKRENSAEYPGQWPGCMPVVQRHGRDVTSTPALAFAMPPLPTSGLGARQRQHGRRRGA